MARPPASPMPTERDPTAAPGPAAVGLADMAAGPGVTAVPSTGPGRLWAAYAGLCALSWMLYAMAGAETGRDGWRLWQAAYDATLNLWPPMLVGTAVLPWVALLQRQPRLQRWRALLHPLAALAFAAAWQALDYAAARSLFGQDHAGAVLAQRVLWRACWGAFVYGALVLGFGGALHARRAQQAAVRAAQAEAARVRAELAAISGKLNPHFLFNTLNALILLTRTDPAAAEQALHRFSQMMRYVLDTQRGGAHRVALADELDFVRDYLALESLRFGPRLRVDLAIDPATLDEPIPPLTLQPLVENSLLHGIAPRVDGGTVRIEAQRQRGPAGLLLRVADDGAGCVWPPVPAAPAAAPGVQPVAAAPAAWPPAPAAGTLAARAATAHGGGPADPGRPRPARGGIGLGALRRRFELDYDGQARLEVRSAPGQGFAVEIFIPFATAPA